LGLDCDEGVCSLTESQSAVAESVPAEVAEPLPQAVPVSAVSVSSTKPSQSGKSSGASVDDLTDLLWGVR